MGNKACVVNRVLYYPCFNALLLSPERLWEAARDVDRATESDQQHVNNAMIAINVKWFTHLNCSDPFHCHIFGVGRHGLNITLVPQTILCRRGCNPSLRDHLYLWHYVAPHDGIKKAKGLRIGDLWYLREDWSEVCSSSSLTGSDWLRQLRTDHK